jgi:hypothetical protein
VLTLYLKEPGKQRRRRGSAAAIAELSTCVSREQLEQERKRQFADRQNSPLRQATRDEDL